MRGVPASEPTPSRRQSIPQAAVNLSNPSRSTMRIDLRVMKTAAKHAYCYDLHHKFTSLPNMQLLITVQETNSEQSIIRCHIPKYLQKRKILTQKMSQTVQYLIFNSIRLSLAFVHRLAVAVGGHNIPLDTLQLASEMIFPANHWTGTKVEKQIKNYPSSNRKHRSTKLAVYGKKCNTTEAWCSRHSPHPTRKQSGSTRSIASPQPQNADKMLSRLPQQIPQTISYPQSS